ncbi:MAG: hypothetical protein IIC91_10070 [Chloroflexi bacterium]|nr:hypothetical protein [Chloroflexota bacterium]
MKVLLSSVDDLRPALRLKELIGSSRAARFKPGQHPLGAGFQALRKRLIGRSLLSLDEVQELGALDFVSRALFDREADWEPNKERLIGDLAKATECSAIIFELQVIRFALERRHGQATWQRYVEGAPDIAFSDPAMLIECKLVRTNELDKDTIFDEISAARKQHKGIEGIPLVVAVGFERNLPREVSNFLQKECHKRDAWFNQRPEVSGGLLFFPRDARTPVFEKLGQRRVSFMEGEVLEVVCHKALNPLKVGFSSLQER